MLSSSARERLRQQSPTTIFNSVEGIALGLASMFKPPERLSVSASAAKYRKLNNPGAFVGAWSNEKAPYLTEPMDELDSRFFEGVAFVGPAQSGKPIWTQTPVATPSGWTTMGELQAGDFVFSEHGEVVRVEYATEVFKQRDCYRIVFDDASEIIADGVHRWAVNDCWASDPHALHVKDTKRLFESYRIVTSAGKARFRYSIPVAGALQLPERYLPLHPYVLGLWLGDGHHDGSALIIGNRDADAIVERVESLGFRATQSDGNSAQTATRVVLKSPAGPSMRVVLGAMGLSKNKHIPSDYLRASERQRCDLLRGLMDTDGTVAANGRIQWSQSNKGLFDQVVELVRSLGYKPMLDTVTPSYSYKGENLKGKLHHRLSFGAEDSTKCFFLHRQIARHKRHLARVKTRPTHSGRRFIRSIVPVDSVPVRCISVGSASHLFLVGEQMVPTHNTDALILNWTLYSVISSPMDLIIYSPSTASARDFSTRRIDRLNRHSPDMGKLLLNKRDSDNKFDKHFINGMMLTLSWPSVNEMSGKPVPRVALTDFDRMDEDIDGDGNPYDLAAKRTTTFGSFKMALAESSPSKPIKDPRYIVKGHEAPPAEGILALYNRGDRRRWVWPCPHCGEYFEARFSMLEYFTKDDTGLPLDHVTASESTMLKCPHCPCLIHPNDRHEMQQWGMWIKEGEAVNSKGQRIGKPRRTKMASFWLNGMAAAFTTWPGLVRTYLTAEEEYLSTGSEEALKKFYNTDLGEPYLPKAVDSERLPEHLQSRVEDLGEREVPEGTRFLVANVDVQKNMFVVQVHGVAPGKPFDMVLIDRFQIRKSKRLDEAGEHLWVKPATYLEDWDLLVEEVMDKTYPLGDGSGRRMAVKLTTCDSGGYSKDKGESVTSMAYEFYRRLRRDRLAGRFHLVKGDSSPGVPRARVTFPDANKKDSKAAARGDVPVLMFNPNILKDSLNARLDCIEPGKGMFRLPNWLPDWWFQEMCAEDRTTKGWEKRAHAKNEAWDLAYYCIGACVSPLLLVEKMDWQNPPLWAAEWDTNNMISEPDQPKRFAQPARTAYDFGKFAERNA